MTSRSRTRAGSWCGVSCSFSSSAPKSLTRWMFAASSMFIPRRASLRFASGGEVTGQTVRVTEAGDIRWGTPAARWVIAATVLGSGIAFLDGTIVNVALKAIGEDLDTGVSGLQWTIDAYLVTLTALLLFGGALGDRFGRRRMFVAGLASFTAASVACGLAPDAVVLAVARGA